MGTRVDSVRSVGGKTWEFWTLSGHSGLSRSLQTSWRMLLCLLEEICRTLKECSFGVIHRSFFFSRCPFCFVSLPLFNFTILLWLCVKFHFKFSFWNILVFPFSLSLFFQEYRTCFATEDREKKKKIQHENIWGCRPILMVLVHFFFSCVVENILLWLLFSIVGCTHVCFSVIRTS